METHTHPHVSVFSETSDLFPSPLCKHKRNMPSANNMGRLSCETAPRLRTAPTELSRVTVQSSTTSNTSKPTAGWCKVSVPKGLLPVTLYSLFFLAFPLISHFVTYDFTDEIVRVGVIVASFLAATIILVANDCVAWFNMALFFHLGVEITVLDTLITFAQASTTSDTGLVLAWTASAVIIIHLLPFFLLDHAGLLTLLAYAGVAVNASALVFVEPTMLLLVGFSSTVLLACVLLIAYIDCVRTSMLSQLRQALTEGTWLMCVKYEM